MRAAPAVSVRCTGGLGWRAAAAVLPALTIAVLVVWALEHADLARMAAAVGLVAGLITGILAWRRLAPRAVQLAWDGQTWSVDGLPGALAVMLDLGPWLLLRLRAPGQGGAHWVPVSAAEVGPAWHALRAAAYSRATAGPGATSKPHG